MIITTHVCRGNFRSTFISSGGYEPVAESLLGKCNYDGYFLEYDTDRAGGFEPLRFLPKGNKIVVLGLVTSKIGALEPRRRHQEAHRGSHQVRRARPARLSPQCGFASTEEGNVLAEDEQWAKLRRSSNWRRRCGGSRNRVPGAAHEITRLAVWCAADPGPLQCVAVPDQRCTANALHRIRDTRARNDPTHHAAFSRRSCRQPAAPGAAKRCARQTRERRS